MSGKVLVVKLGTAVISNQEGNIDTGIIQKVAAEIALLSKKYKLVLVSSGAVGSGKKFLRDYKGTLSERKAAAAVGNPILIQLYAQYFAPHGITGSAGALRTGALFQPQAVPAAQGNLFHFLGEWHIAGGE